MKTTKPNRRLIQQIKENKKPWIIGASVIVFGVTGLILMSLSSAATNAVAVEAESGNRAGNQTAGTTGGASGGASVRFGGAASPDPSPNPSAMPAITVSGNKIMRNGQPWWLIGYNSFVWSANCGHSYEKMSAADVEAWFASMRHDGHGGVRLFFFDGWDFDRLDAAVASAKKHNVYLTITLDDAIAGCGESEKDTAWFNNAGERATYKAHMEKLLNRYKGETAIAWFEYFNEPDYEGGKLRQFYDEMGAIAAQIDPNRLWSSGTVAPYWVDGEGNFKNIHESPGVDIASLHEYDQDEAESNHGPRVRNNSAGKPTIAGEFGIYSSPSGSGCKTNFSDRANRFNNKLKAYTNTSIGYAGAFAWAWQPGDNSACHYGNLDVDTPSQNILKNFQP